MSAAGGFLDVPGVARLDVGRRGRTGLPELVLGEGKTPQQVAAIAQAMLAVGEPVLVTRATAEQDAACRDLGLGLLFDPVARVLASKPPLPGLGRVALFCAGTADLPVAKEAEWVLAALGTRAELLHDVGLAGPQRAAWAVEQARRLDAHAWIVAAGRDAALATYVAAHADVPVIGVPVSTGYGHGGRGEAALMAMLQSCAPLAVVNIDAGCVAALLAHQIASRSEARVPPTVLVDAAPRS